MARHHTIRPSSAGMMVVLFPALFLAQTAQAKILRLGIIAGHNTGFETDHGLRFAEADAQKMAQLFKEVGGMEEEDVILLKSPRPEHLDLAFETVSRAAETAKPEDEVIFLFYFSGHGTREYLKFGRQSYSLQRLKEQIERVPAKLRIGIVDACQSGAITRMKGAKVSPPFLVEQDLKSTGSILIASSSADENSQESDEIKGSFFTHHWHSALRGAGDVSGDRRVSLLEAYQYAYGKTLLQTKGSVGGAQHANAQFKLDTEGDVILTDLNQGNGGLSFGSDLVGDMLVANARAEVMAEFHKDAGREFFLALPPGAYRIYKREGRRTRECAITLAGAETKAVKPSDMRSGFQLTGNAKGGNEEDVKLPWKVGDWSTQFPLEMGFGYGNDDYGAGWTWRLGYKPMTHLAATVSFGSSNFLGQPKYTADEGLHDLDVSLGLQFSKFFSPNLEFLLTPYHRSYGDANWVWPSRDCSVEDCTVAPKLVNVRTWDFGRHFGLDGGLRVWLAPHLSFQVQYGTELTFDHGYSFAANDLLLMPSLHF